ncbi:penicillin-binding protein 1B [Litorivicinus lipolyticus]|uniref:Penicillin-binding protein 1B n=1 Tax=Litorivicinus lipolyticus TaxID=418701 RepID=A0A5Q2Q8N7_9GAMM|nr:transglycosylase domain-containing protein [Litorivicinus lipolyticus]QGG81089.1 penicillin-binding protein 1B [Litorivicinus lipolyticus]
METKQRGARLALKLALTGSVVVALWVIWLNARVTQVLDDFRWEVPAKIYARALEIYPGARLSPDQLEGELRRLGYQKSSTSGPGRYLRAGNRVQVFTRGFVFPDGAEPARRLNLTFAASTIATLEGAAIARLEPPLIGTLVPGSGEDRTLLRAADTPALLSQGLLAVEDRRFQQHLGLDVRGLARAMVTNVKAGRVVQGGSTLTQQLVKNLFLTRDKTLTRKLNEAAMALLVEWHYDKAFILQAYLNQAYLGQSGDRAIHGFSRASAYWFARPLAELAPADLAVLVGLVKGPSAFNPRRHPTRALNRRNAVLDVWLREGLLSDAEHARARTAPLGVSERPGTQQGRFPGYLRLVKQALLERYPKDVLETEGLTVLTPLDPILQDSMAASARARLAQFEKAGRGSNLQAAAVVLAAGTGEVRALLGDRAGQGIGFDRALDARRQVGSLLKPLVYLHAFEQGLNALSPVDDVPVSITTSDGVWQPKNYSGDFDGQVPLFVALSESKNLAAVTLAQRLGFAATAKTAQRAGVEVNPDLPSWVLGAHLMSPYQVAQLYALFANDGFEVPPKLIRAVLRPDGEGVDPYPTQPSARLDSRGVYQLQQVLAQVMSRGTGRFIGERLGRSVAGKSGTSNDQRDSWFAGFDAANVVAVWVGSDDNQATRLTGSSGAGLVWLDVMRTFPGAGLGFRQPAGVEVVWVDDLGRLASADCPSAQQVVVQSDRMPEPGQCSNAPSLWSRVKQIFGG